MASTRHYSVEADNLGAFVEDLRQDIALAVGIAKAGVSAGSETIKDIAHADTPIRTGRLRSTGHVEHSGGGELDEHRIVFGGAEAPYAVLVHEMLGRYHPIGHAKYLENAAVNNVAKVISDAVAKAFS